MRHSGATGASSWIVLSGELPAVVLDPEVDRESRARLLQPGALVEDAVSALDRAEAAGHHEIVIRVRGDNVVHLARVRCGALRGAMPRREAK